MVRVFHLSLFLAAALLISSCNRSKPASPEAQLRFESIIPKPVSSQLDGNAFVLTSDTRIVIGESGKNIENVANFLAEKLKPATGYDLEVLTGENPGKGTILLSLAEDEELGPEGYELTIGDNGIKVTANESIGLYWGVQTLRQMLPEEIENSSNVADISWEIATGTIRDYPQYSWRGSMLDIARHFFGVDDIKHYIDLISLYKINTLHLHLSDDQGWRIEIKSWPNLALTGGQTQVGGGEGGYLTQEQYSDIVDYASRRYITIVPEIDMPGHINAALVSYKELNLGPPIRREPASSNPDRPKAGEVYTGIQVGFSTLDVRKEITFRFVNDVLRELAEITPGPYLHIGGDEAAVTKKPDYIAFIDRFKDIVKANGKQMIGWEEIAQAALDSTITVQHWHSQQYARMAADKGAKLIFSPAQKVYLDMQYDSTTKLGLHWAAYIEVDSSYMWDPATQVPGIDPSQIRGVEAPLWSETTVTMDDVEYMVFPRLPGVAEVGWTKAQDRNWDDYKIRLANQSKRWEALDINYYRSPKVPWIQEGE
ncbi:MAG TPA: beta-N-acetylhexosaminidase [Chryseosolibacter sp.]